MTFNSSSATKQTCDLVDISAVNPFFIVIYSLMFVVGLVLNGFTLNFYFCRVQRKPSSSLMVYLKNLTAADFLFCLSLPLFIIKYTRGSVIIRQLFCSFGGPSFTFNMYARILFMGYIAANRYLKIVHPSGTHILQTVQSARIFSTVTWVCVLALTITYPIVFIINEESMTSDDGHCNYLSSDLIKWFFEIFIIIGIIIFLLVLISLVFFYYSISRKVLLAQQSQLASSGSKKLVKSRRNLLVLVSVFCVCFIPIHLLMILIPILWKNCSTHQVLYYAMNVATIMSALNVCLDPMVYFFLCKAFRAQVNQRMAPKRSQINIQQASNQRRSFC